MTSTSKKLILLCTGLGNVQRGFEMYISGLAKKLQETELGPQLELWTGGDFKLQGVITKRIVNLRRGSLLGRQLKSKAFLWEQRSFFLGMLPMLLKNREPVFYLGEYQLYCYLYKFRKISGLKYKLVLYTGGQALPGLFDDSHDYVHHVTDAYLAQCRHIPMDRQFVLPHFIEEDFLYDKGRQATILQKAAGKKIVLSVGLIDKRVKQMHLFVEALIPLREDVFPVILGEYSKDTPEIKALLDQHFGPAGYILSVESHAQLGDWYAVADLFVLCSPRESFGLAMVEAMYHGVPVICHDLKEARFVLKDKAAYAPVGKSDCLTNSIFKEFKIISDRIAHTNFVIDNYSWASLQSCYLSMFNSILA